MRKSIAFFGGALFVVMSLSIYLVVDQLSKMPSYESVIEAQVNRKVIEPLVKIEKDMDRLEKKIKLSEKAVNQLKGDATKLGDNPVSDQPILNSNTSPRKTFQSLVHVDKENDSGCKFSKTPSGLSSDVKMLDVYDFLPFDNPDGGAWKQGWNVQREKNEEHLDVFVIPHSHNDPGWIKTLDAYYQDQTRHILDNVVDALALDKRRKFIWAEMSYLSMWWEEVDDRRKKLFKEQVKNGQMEIVTGGWVMNDEANTHYFAMIDQLIEGQQWLEANIGVKPQAGWAIDPFGHTPTMAYILKRSGFHSMLIQRTHYAVKKYLARRKKLEFMWRQNWDHSSSTDMFCHMMPFYSYDVPHTCGPEPAICCQFDFRRLPGGGIQCPWHISPVKIDDNNVAQRAEKLLDQYRKKATLYKSNIVLIPLGDDFRYEMKFETTEQFSNYQRLFDYMNSHPKLKVKAQFGTLSDYFNKLWEKNGVKPGKQPPGYPTLSGDFYTYADRDDHYWSGYFTTRPFYKNMDRVLESRLRAAEIIYHLAYSHARKDGVKLFPSTNLFHLLMQARRNLGVFQHHDGITGTAKDHVVVDYGFRLLRSLQDTARIIEDSSYFLLHKSRKDYKPNDESLTMVQYDEERKGQDGFPTKRILAVKSSKPRKVTLYNSLEGYRVQVVSILVSTLKIKVTNATGHTISFQVSPVFDNDFKPVPNSYRVHFVANIPPLGLATYTIEETSSVNSLSSVYLYHHVGDVNLDKEFTVERKDWDSGDIVLENDALHVTFDSSHGTMVKLTTVEDGKTLDLLMAFMTYGTAHASDRSGAYLFLPDGPAQPLNLPSHSRIIVLKGRIFNELTVQLPLVQHRVRLYNVPGPEGMTIDIENAVDIREEHNRELAMRFSTNILNNNEIFTDLNGFQMQLHKTLTKLPLQANFYPMPNSAIIQDKKTRLTLHSAQANGVASLKSGSLEVILDRRLTQDDNRGLGQGVMDNKRTPANFRLFVEKFQALQDESSVGVPLTYHSLASNTISQHLSQPISILHHSHTEPSTLTSIFAGLSRPLPCDMFVVNLRTIQKGVEPEPTDEAALLLRRHGYDCSFPTWCKTTSGKISFQRLFKDLEVRNIQQTSLTLMHNIKTVDRDATIKLKPMEIYTYKLSLS
ncbi:alpha-mannosidase 2-like [Dendronephthya gigantea]|uniref:alpha-mannosidase 2-like n=1 Tax=Dendronephthya gigantea TaxID=151771 RepID=UPI00106C7F3E|nr:alpha-mannosidase 2-like [Dendronephthya gigantea]